MDKKELELKIKSILSNSNIFDVLIEANDFNKEYKKTSFYKKTKIKLIDILKYSKIFYMLQPSTIIDNLQSVIDSLDTEKILQAIDNISEVFSNENQETMEMLNSLEDFKVIITSAFPTPSTFSRICTNLFSSASTSASF